MNIGRRPLVAFALEQVLGHVSLAQMLKRHAPAFAAFDTEFIDVTFHLDGGRIERLPLPAAAKASWRARREIQQALAGRRADAFVFNTQKPALFCPDYLRNAPSVIALDVTPRQYDDMGEYYDHARDGAGAVRWIKHRWNAWVFQHARRLFPWSQWAADSLVSDYGVDPGRIRVIPPGADIERWRPNGREPHERVRILFVGGHFERKGGRMLLDWFRNAPEAASCELHIVTRSEIAAGERMHVYRDMTNNSEDLVRLAQSCDVFALPTLADCFSLASLEAMAVGLPVAVSAAGGIADIFEDGTCGFMHRPGDSRSFAAAMRQLVTDDALRMRMGAAARARVEDRFDARKNVGEIVEEVQALLDATPVTARRGRPESRGHSARA